MRLPHPCSLAKVFFLLSTGQPLACTHNLITAAVSYRNNNFKLNLYPSQRVPSAGHRAICSSQLGHWKSIGNMINYIGTHVAWMFVRVSLIYYCVVLSDGWLFFFFQVARNSLHRPAVVLRLSRLQVLDGVMVTLEERTRAELLSSDPSVRPAHSMHTVSTHTGLWLSSRTQRSCPFFPLSIFSTWDKKMKIINITIYSP